MARHAFDKTFTAEVNGTAYEFKCWGTPGSHYCEDQDGRRTRHTYGNRPWESFRFETVLSKAIEKCPKGMQNEMHRQLIDGEAAKEEERCEAMFNNFKRLHEGLSDENKRRLADSNIMINSEDDARAVMGLMGLMTLMQG